MKKKKNNVVVALFVLAAMTGSSLAAEPLQPEGEQATAADGGSATPGDSEAKAEDQAGASGTAGESASDDNQPKKEYRHRPGACPEGPPCKSED